MASALDRPLSNRPSLPNAWKDRHKQITRLKKPLSKFDFVGLVDIHTLVQIRALNVFKPTTHKNLRIEGMPETGLGNLQVIHSHTLNYHTHPDKQGIGAKKATPLR